ncbi:MAG: HigA family addiction module antidote protein [Acidobacteriia bacterium]|nr:HigA family addiction module antidote protein [Terriglobia bacterium]
MSKLKPVHPGEILVEDFLRPLGLTANKLAIELRVAPHRLYQIVNCERRITADTALRLGRYFGTTAAFWMNLQTQFDLDSAEDQMAEEINQAVRPRDSRVTTQ